MYQIINRIAERETATRADKEPGDIGSSDEVRLKEHSRGPLHGSLSAADCTQYCHLKAQQFTQC